MAIFSESFRDKFRYIWNEYDEILIVLGVLIIFIIELLIIVAVGTSVMESTANGGIIIDKFITKGSLYFMVMTERNGETEYLKINVRPEKYYTTNIGEVYERK